MIAAVVVTHSAPAEVLQRCLEALSGTQGLDQIIVVHNGADGDVPTIDRPGVRVLHTENHGYGAAANRGIALVPDADAVIVMNDDVVVQPGWLPPLVAAIEPDDVGAAQPMLVGADHSFVTSLGVEIDRFGAGHDIGDGEPVPDVRGVSPLEIFNGGALLCDTGFLRATGGFDERWFMYYEDVDLACRGRRLGWTYRLVTTSMVEHRRGTTASEHADLVRHLQERNRLWAAFRWAPPATIARALWLSVRRLRHPPRRLHARALVAGIAGVPHSVAARLRWARSG